MELTNKQGFETYKALTQLSDQKWPRALAWKIHLATTALKPFITSAEKIIGDAQLEFALKDEKGENVLSKDEKGNEQPGTFVIPNDKIADFYKAISEIQSQTFTVENVALKLEEFPETAELEPATLGMLAPLFS